MAIPLHRSARWIEVIESNVRALAPVAQVVLSDAGESDATLATLRERLAGLHGVEFLASRPGCEGWVSHCNDLQSRCATEFFMWLPHDDSIATDWVIEAQHAFDARPDAALACGRIVASPDPGCLHAGMEIPLDPRLSDASGQARAAAVLEMLTVAGAASLGLLFRALQRRSLAVPLRSTDGNLFVDISWAVDAVARGAVAPVESTYIKRWYGGSTHSAWPAFGEMERVRAEWAPRAVAGLASDEALSIMAHAWQRDVDLAHGRRVAEGASATEALEGERRERQESDLRVRAEYERSRSWRMTAPLRWLMRATKTGEK